METIDKDNELLFKPFNPPVTVWELLWLLERTLRKSRLFHVKAEDYSFVLASNIIK